MIRKILFLFALVAAFTTQLRAQGVLQDSVVGNVRLTNDRPWLVKGFVYVVNGATLTIDPGTIIYGEKSSKGTIIVERGGKIMAQGTEKRPIVFTSQQPIGQRASGDWGGIVLCGRAPINQNNSDNGGTAAGGEAQIEGGPRSKYGGTDPHDNSGVLSYVRIEFPGVALSPNNEINGLTLGGVGDATQIDHVQVSYSGDDNYEWFGGTVNAKYLIGYKCVDDDWDTDFGWSGRIQFGLSIRDPFIADVSQSNGFESDNDNPPNFWTPRTSARVSNLTVVGPKAEKDAPASPLFGRAAHIRRNSRFSIYNSVLMGFPQGIYIDGDGTALAAKGDTLQIRNTIVAGYTGDAATTNASAGTGFNAATWFYNPAYGNRAFVQPDSVKLTLPFNINSPDPRPQAGSIALSGASFNVPALQDAFFTPTSYVGAFDGTNRWDANWANYNPENTNYAPTYNAITKVNFANTLVGQSRDSGVIVFRNTGIAAVTILNSFTTDSTRFKITTSTGEYAILGGDSALFRIRYTPKDTLGDTQWLKLVMLTGDTVSIQLTGKGSSKAVANLFDTKLDFAQVNLNDNPVKDLTISNTGNDNLTIKSISISGANQSEFSLVSNGDLSIPSNGKNSIKVRFTPTSLGAKTATLHFETNTTPASYDIPLLGTGIQVYAQDILQDSVTGNVTLTNDRTWLLRGFVYVVDGATLNIQPGTVIKGEKATKGTLIVERGGKINAIGTAQKPIVFTSQQPMGQRAAGDWGGIILCGRAPINQNNTINGGTAVGGEAQIEGGPRSKYGGNNPDDNSGRLSYVRIEYPGVALSPNNEINGLTLGGVGRGTQIDHIQVSYSGDDNYEWFGGTVNAKFLIGYKGVDDDWDTDFGWSGKLQFGISVRDPQISDISESNGFESDNDNPPNFWNPRTSPVVSNLTVVGPQADTGAAASPLFGRAAHLRRNTQLSIYNTVMIGFPRGIFFDGAGVVNAAKNDTIQIRNCVLGGLRPGKDFLTNVTDFDPAAWYRTPAFGNLDYVQPSSVKLADAFNASVPNFRPMTGSPAATGASFDNARLKDPFFTSVNYRGAIDPNGPRWDSAWTNYNPQNTDYSAKPEVTTTTVVFPATLLNTPRDTTIQNAVTNNGEAPLVVKSVTLSSGTDFSLIDNIQSGFVVEQHESKSIRVRFQPTSGGVKTQTITITYADNSTATITLTGEGVTSGVAVRSVAPAVVLGQNVPNPFTSVTKINYELIKAGHVTLQVFDAAGRVVETLVNTTEGVGNYSVSFDGANLPQGVYYYRLTAAGTTLTRHMVITR